MNKDRNDYLCLVLIIKNIDRFYMFTPTREMKREDWLFNILWLSVIAVMILWAVVFVNQNPLPSKQQEDINSLVRSCSDISLSLEQVADRCISWAVE